MQELLNTFDDKPPSETDIYICHSVSGRAISFDLDEIRDDTLHCTIRVLESESFIEYGCIEVIGQIFNKVKFM
jgi:hypothetical protein